MDTKTPIKLEGARLARAPATGALCALALFSLLAPPHAAAQVTPPTPTQQAVLLYTRITGVPPSPTILTQISSDVAASNMAAVATLAVSQPQFYNVTLRNIFAAESNRDGSVFVPLNDYIVTAIGMVHDDVPYNTALSADILYTLKGVSPGASASDNKHYAAADAAVTDISANLMRTQQTVAYGYSSASVAGLITTRAGVIQHFDAGTNRRGYNINIINQTCHQMENITDTSLPADRIRQDVAASPGADSRVRLQSCVGCHSHMDPMAGAFAYYDYDETKGNMIYTAGKVQPKYFINASNNQYGYVTTDDSWESRIRLGGADAKIFNFDPNLPGKGNGAAAFGQEIAGSGAYASCQVQKAFKAVCLRAPSSSKDGGEIDALTLSFKNGGYKLKQVFADAALYCTAGPGVTP
ncbi:MAG: hypothetical protein QOI59_2292 [Gammaproteobacteria bacterium]|jgi:hypothetical protein|nr:hypothetical protein [Gammaproteobacteria bacterium]